MQIKRNVLLNPGPATTTDTVKMAQIVPDICPREKEFVSMMKQMREDLVRIVHGDLNKYTSVLFCGSGTITMDVCINSLLPKGKKILIINNGTYSMRAVEICEYYNLPFVNFDCPIDEIPDLNQVEQILKENQDIALVYTTHNETGTGILNPIKEIGFLVHKYSAVFIVDTISTYAMKPIDIEKIILILHGIGTKRTYGDDRTFICYWKYRTDKEVSSLSKTLILLQSVYVVSFF